MSRKAWMPAAAAVAVAIGAVVLSRGDRSTAGAQARPGSTAQVQRGELSAIVSGTGTVTYRARPDGSPFSVINRARGTFTSLPAAGDEIGCGGALYRVDDEPVLLLCGPLPAYRALRPGDAGRDVAQLNRNLRVPGDAFTAATGQALRTLQRRMGLRVDGTLGLGEAVVLPGPVRIAAVAAEPGAPARPGSPVLRATSRTLQVQVGFDPSQHGQVARGDHARITLPGHRTVTGRVAGFGRLAKDGTIPTYIRLDDPRRARGLDRAPVEVQVATHGVDDALSVPVTALVGRSGGGFAVEVERRGLVAVEVGVFDGAAGRVQVEGDLRAGERVVVPSP